MTGVRHGRPAGPGVVDDIHAGSQVQPGKGVDNPVEPGQQLGRRPVLQGIRPQRRPKLAHHRGRLQTSSHDVTDRDPHPTIR